MANCQNCGAEVGPGTNKCAYCGAAVAMAAPPAYVPQQQAPIAMPAAQAGPVQQKSKVAAGILGILLGVFGVHNFYLGFNGKGAAQLIITLATCGYGAVIVWIWGLIEGVMILTGSISKDARGVPLKD